MDTKDIQATDLSLNYALEPEAPKTQTPSPTCPFIKHHNVKELPSKTRHTDKKPDTQRSPIFLPEEGVSSYVGDRAVEALASRPVKRHLGLAFDSVNRLFAILFQFFFKAQFSLPAVPSWLKMMNLPDFSEKTRPQ